MELSKALAFFPNIHITRKHSAHSLTISLGAGIGGVVYQLSCRNQQGKAFVGIHFDQSREDMYRSFCLHKSLITKKVHPNIVMENRSSGYTSNSTRICLTRWRKSRMCWRNSSNFSRHTWMVRLRGFQMICLARLGKREQ